MVARSRGGRLRTATPLPPGAPGYFERDEQKQGRRGALQRPLFPGANAAEGCGNTTPGGPGANLVVKTPTVAITTVSGLWLATTLHNTLGLPYLGTHWALATLKRSPVGPSCYAELSKWVECTGNIWLTAECCRVWRASFRHQLHSLDDCAPPVLWTAEACDVAQIFSSSSDLSPKPISYIQLCA